MEKEGVRSSRSAAQPRLAKGRLQQHIDREDYRIKGLTESVLHDFLPAAIHAAAIQPAQQCDLPSSADLDQNACLQVAAAALSVATLLNAPPGFLEFLLCLPWTELPGLYATFGDGLLMTRQEPLAEEVGDDAASPRHVPDIQKPNLRSPSLSERACIVNRCLNSIMIDCAMDFLYSGNRLDCLPPVMSLGPGESYAPGNGERAGPLQRAVRAMLEGSTVLHCAAVRGNPAQVDALLLSGADPLLKNAVGELPLELVPYCGDAYVHWGGGTASPTLSSSGPTVPSADSNSAVSPSSSCRCMGRADREAWECRSRIARMFLVRRCMGSLRDGVWAWFKLCLLCIACLMGWWGCHTTLRRPPLEARGERRWAKRRRQASARAHATLLQLRTAAARGRQELDAYTSGIRANKENRKGHLSGFHGDPNGPEALERGGGPAAFAHRCHSMAIELLCNFRRTCSEMRVPPGDWSGVLVPEAKHLPSDEWAAVAIFTPEQASLWNGWCETAFAALDECGCAGCHVAAAVAIDTAVGEILRLIDLKGQEMKNNRKAMESAMLSRYFASVVSLKAKFLLRTEVHGPVTRAGVWKVQQCLSEWRHARALLEACDIPAEEPLEIQCIDSWATTAASDVLLAEALLGGSVPPLQPLGEVLPAVAQFDDSVGGLTSRPVTKLFVRHLEVALEAGKSNASAHIIKLVETAIVCAREEVEVGERLRELLSGGVSDAVEEFEMVMDAASRFPSLRAEVDAALATKGRWAQRAAAQEKLASALEVSSAPAPPQLLFGQGVNQSIDVDRFWEEAKARMEILEAAIDGARQANVGVAGGKKLLKELQAQCAAVEAATKLDHALVNDGLTGSVAFKVALSRAEEAYGAAASGAGSFKLGYEILGPRLQNARAKLALERATESLMKASATCHALGDLPKLEAALVAARRVGVHDAEPDVYRAAADLRTRFEAANKARTAVQNAIRTLQRHHTLGFVQQQKTLAMEEDTQLIDAEAKAEAAITAAAAFGDVLEAYVAKAREAMTALHAKSAADAKLARALRDAPNATALSRAIKEAASAGLKLGDARRVLKLMQALESAVSAASSEDKPPTRNALQTKIAAASAGGVPAAVVADARRTLRRVLLSDAHKELELALRTAQMRPLGGGGDGRTAVQRIVVLRSAVERVEDLLSTDLDAQSTMPSPRRDDLARSQEFIYRSSSFITQSGSSAASSPMRSMRGPSSQFEDQQLKGSDSQSQTVELVHLRDCNDIELHFVVVEGVVAIWFEPSIENQRDEASGDEAGPIAIVGSENASVALRKMVSVARRLLEREERIHSRIERQIAAEGRARKEAVAREKAAREAAEKERADRARAERAARKAAAEAARTVRRERELAATLERERQRQSREAAAKEHFSLLQKHRKMMLERSRTEQLVQMMSQMENTNMAVPPELMTGAAVLTPSPGLQASRQPLIRNPSPDVAALEAAVMAVWQDDGPGSTHDAPGAVATQGMGLGSAGGGGYASADSLSPGGGSTLLSTLSGGAGGSGHWWSCFEFDASTTAQNGVHPALGADISTGRSVGDGGWISNTSSGMCPPPGSYAQVWGDCDVMGPDGGVSGSRDSHSQFSGNGNGALWGVLHTDSVPTATAVPGSSGDQMPGFLSSSVSEPGTRWSSTSLSPSQPSALTSILGAPIERDAHQAAREAELIAALDAARAQQLQPPRELQPRACRYHFQGFCRDGDACRYSHGVSSVLDSFPMVQSSQPPAAYVNNVLLSSTPDFAVFKGIPSEAWDVNTSGHLLTSGGTGSVGEDPFGRSPSLGGSLPLGASLSAAMDLGSPIPLPAGSDRARSAGATPRAGDVPWAKDAEDAEQHFGLPSEASLFADFTLE